MLEFRSFPETFDGLTSVSVYRERVEFQGQCLATCKSLANREKNLFAGHFRGNFLRSRA